MNLSNLKLNLLLDEINAKCEPAFLKLLLFQYNVNNISYFREHIKEKYKKYLYKNLIYNKNKYLFLGQLDEKTFVLFPYKKLHDNIFDPLMIISTKYFNELKFLKQEI